MTPEGRVKKAITALLKNRGDVYFYMPVPSGYGKRSLDYIGCSRGRFFAIEAKAPGKEPTELQDICISEMRRAGATVFIIDDNASMVALNDWLG